MELYNKIMLPDINLLTIFTTGLLTGGITCVAVQGGLLATALVQDSKINPSATLRAGKQDLRVEKRENLIPVLAFIVSKLFAYTLLGFALGLLGSLIQVSIQTRIILQFLIISFMIGTAFSLLKLHPIFDNFLIAPSKALSNIAYRKSNDHGVFAAMLLGLFTVFIPCGATQAMMALAVSSGNSLQGALIMFIFVLGTSPVFILLGLVTVRLKSAFNKKFVKIAAYAIILLALFNLDAVLALSNSPTTISSVVRQGYCLVGYCASSFAHIPVSEQTITFSPTGYSPNHFAVRKGTQVTLRLINENASGCIQSFTISSLNIQKIVLPNTSEDIVFIAPNKEGTIRFTCSAGFYPGTIEVI